MDKWDNLAAEKLTPEEQKRRFIEAAREVGANEGVEAFRENPRQIVKPKQPASGG